MFSVAGTLSLLSTPVGALSRLSQYRYGSLFPFSEQHCNGSGWLMATAVTPSAPPARTYTLCTPEQWDAWYCAVQGLDTNMDLLSTIGQELRSHKVAFAEHWGDTLNALQLQL